MKHTKRIFAILLSLAMILTMTIAMSAVSFAAEGDGEGETPAATPAYDNPLTVTGLDDGDTVQFYQVIKWVGEAEGNVAGWKAVDAYASVLDKETLTAILVGDPKADPPVQPTGITSEIAGKLAKLATGGTPGTISEGTATLNNTEAGMWMAIVTPKDANTIYNPVFVSADYNKDAPGTVAMTAAYKDAVAKKSTLTLNKTASDITNAYGDTVNFTVTTTIPGYGDVYEHPHFTLTDTLKDLALNEDTVKVTDPKLEKGEDYTVAATPSGYTITFAEKYLKTVKAATNVTVTYSAIVTSEAQYAVNEEDNEVYIEYSHNPNAQSDYDVKKDTTQHYTFSIDAEGAGSGQSVTGKKTSEIVKIGVDAAGNPIKTTKQTSEITSTESWEGPLEGAVFGLFTDAAGTVPYKAKNADGTPGDTPMTATTGADGRMNFRGLDAGTYYLKEISAPSGFVTDSTVHTVVISAETESVKVTEWWNGSEWVSTKPDSGTAKEVTYDTDVLKSYTVTIDGQETATYTFANAAANSNEIQWENATLVEHPFELVNTQGTELPSTGGIGTIIFYVIGTILVIGCGIVLISKRRLNANK